MSYILEALKKAEAERNGAMHRAPPLLPPVGAAAKHRPAWRRPLPWAAFAALSITLASAAWFTVRGNDAVKAAAPPPAPIPETAPPVAQAAPEIPVEKPRDKPKPAPKKPVEKKAVEKKRSEEPKVAPAPEPAVGTLQDLPEQIRREIPAINVGGYIYSGNKADRSVLVNNRLLREGDEAAPGLVVEKMTPSGMVLNYKGYRYRRGYK